MTLRSATTLLLLCCLLAPAAAALPPPDDAAPAGRLADAVDSGKDATLAQAALLGLDLGAAPTFTVRHASPSEAAFALVARMDAPMDAAQEAQVRALDQLPAEQRAALVDAFDAFLAFDDATRLGLADGDASTGVAPILRARLDLLDAAGALADAFTSPALVGCGVTVAPAFALDLLGCTTTYYSDVALLIDVGGADVYRNNAGGSNTRGVSTYDCSGGPSSGALIDLAGNDQYVSGRGCGINGGASFGSGFLFDAQGTDVYTAGYGGTNGGAAGGVGFLLDALGDDDYNADWTGANGGGSNGVGALVDLAGNDEYNAGYYAANGGASLGAGLLLDATGNDRYVSNGESTVNGGGFLGVGLLVDGAGTDTYTDYGGTATDESVAPKYIAGAQLDLTSPTAFLHPHVDPNPDGTCWVYNDSDGDGVRERDENFADQLGTVPCTVNPAFGQDQYGRCWVYNDMDRDGQVDGWWEPILDVPCPPTTTLATPPVQQSVGAPATSTPGVPASNATTPPVGAPAPCFAAACTSPTNVPGTSTPPVPQQCVPLVACVGPVAPQPLTPPASVPALCSVVGAACLPGVMLVPSQTVPLPGVASVPLTPASSVGLNATAFQFFVDLHAGELGTTGPTTVNVGPVPVVLCPSTCPSPVPPEVGYTGDLVLTVTVGATTVEEQLL